MSSLSTAPSLPSTAISSGSPVTFGQTRSAQRTSINISDNDDFYSKRPKPQGPPQKSAFRKYAWPGTLIATGLFLGLTTGFGIPIIGHLAGLVMVGWGMNKAWTEFRGAPASQPAYSSFDNNEEYEDDETPPSYEESVNSPEMHEANHAVCSHCKQETVSKKNGQPDQSKD
jgi:hypothetical protein